MKKILSLFTILFSIIFLVSCTTNNPQNPTEEEKYQIIYNLDGGVLPSDAVKTFIDGSKVTLPVPSKDNHLFKGWFDKDDNLINNLNGVEDDITLYAKWEEFILGVTYNIEYVLNGGFFDTEVSYTYETGEEYTLPIPVKPGHNFISWCDYDTNEEVSKVSSTKTGDVKVYAWFEKATLVRDITYHVDGGILPETTKYTYTEGTGQDLPSPKKEGFYFRGWYSTASFEKRISAISNGSYGNKELYAKWVEATIENANFSILGDSISTFYDTNSIINSIFTGSGQFYFPRYGYSITNVKQTWWYKTINTIGGNIFVNNSYSGGTVHANGISSGNNTERISKFNYKGEVPDVIIIYLGINDTGGEFTKEFFKNEYKGMIDKILTMFSDVQIFICSLPYELRTNGVYRTIYNEAIVELAEENNIQLIDFQKAWSPETENISDFYDDGLHPNIEGMERLANIAIQKIKEFYNLD